MFADVEGLVMTSQATKDGDGIDMSFVGSITSTRSTPRRADVVFYFCWTVFCLALFTETPDAIFDVIDGGFRTKPALGLKELGYLSVAHRGWKLKHAPIACLDTILLESPGFCDIHAGLFLGTNDVAHPDPQRCLLIRACRGVSAGKGSRCSCLS